MGGRGQNWSLDLIIGVVIFLLAIGVIYSLLSNKSREDVAPLRIESEVIATKLTTPEAATSDEMIVATDNQLDIEKLQELTKYPGGYDALKEELGVQNDFCIYLQDENGNVIYIEGDDGKYTGIGPGSPELNLSGVPCGCPTCTDDMASSCYGVVPGC